MPFIWASSDAGAFFDRPLFLIMGINMVAYLWIRRVRIDAARARQSPWPVLGAALAVFVPLVIGSILLAKSIQSDWPLVLSLCGSAVALAYRPSFADDGSRE